MAIRSISREEFDAFNPFRAPDVDLVMTEVEWFADDGGVVIGLITQDIADRDWFAGVLGRDQRGVFRAIDMESCIPIRDEARQMVIKKMEQALATGERVFPQED